MTNYWHTLCQYLMVGSMTIVDGRHVRREQNREAVVEALVELYREGRYDPSAAEIAERAGLSPRSLFRYFDDADDLARAAIAHHHRLARPLLRIPAAPTDPLAHRVERFVEARLELWSAVAPSARVGRMRAPVSALLADELRRNRRILRRQIEELFAAELAERPALLGPIDVLCSFESTELLLHDHRMSRARATAALVDALHTLLAPPGGRP